MPRNLFKVMAGISASKPNPLTIATVKPGLSDAGNCNYWLESDPPYAYNNSLGRWEVTHKQGAYSLLADNPDCPETNNGWASGYRPATLTVTAEYKGGLGSCTMNWGVVAQTPMYPTMNLVTGAAATIAFTVDTPKTFVLNLIYTGSEAEADTNIKGVYPYIIENDPTPLFYITQLDFSY